MDSPRTLRTLLSHFKPPVRAIGPMRDYQTPFLSPLPRIAMTVERRGKRIDDLPGWARQIHEEYG